MKRLSALLILVLSMSLCTTGCSKRRGSSNEKEDSWVTTAPIPDEAEPVRNWLQSIKARDIELFKTVFSKRMRPVMEQQGWGPSLGVYTLLWTDKLGDYDLDEITFDFTPSDIDDNQSSVYSGHVTVERDGLVFPPIDVVYEQDGWKVDER